MGLTYKNNAPVKFITGTYLGYDAENDRCNCFTRPFCQLVERLDTTDYQVVVTPKSGDLVLDGGFGAACGVNWTCGVDWTIAAGVATKAAGGGGNSLTQSICIMPNRYYVITVTVTAISAGTLTITLGAQAVGTATTVGIKTFYLLGTAISNTLISFTDVAGTLVASIDNVTITELSQIGYEIETQTGTSIFTDVAVSTPTYFQDTGQITVDWTQASTDDCYVVCNHDSADYREMICNGTFDVTEQWALTGAFTIAGGVANSAGVGTMTQTLLHPLIGGRCYTMTLDVTNFAIGGGTGVTIATLPDNILIGFLDSNGAKSFNFDLTGQANQTGIQFSSDGITNMDIDNVSVLMQVQCFEEDACSECYKLADTWDCSFLFSWTNDENAFGFEYVGLTFVQFFRHIIKLYQPVYTEDAERFLDSGGTETVLFAQRQKIEALILQEMPEYLHDSFSLAWFHDTVTIETVNYTKTDGDYEPNWRKSSLLAPVELQVRENGQDLVNENC